MSEKKHKGGYELLKEKYDALQKEKEILVQTAQENYCRLERECEKNKEKITELTSQIKEANAKASESQKRDLKHLSTISEQSRKISQLTADLKVAQGNLEATEREHERQLKEMYDHMGWFKRMTWDWHHAPTFKEDERWNETH